MSDIVIQILIGLFLFGLGALITFAVRADRRLKDISEESEETHRETTELLNMHKAPDSYGFGTKRSDELLRDISEKIETGFEKLIKTTNDLIVEIRTMKK